MIRILFGFISIMSFIVCLDNIVESYPDGMPKIIKTYNGYGKLELNKEVGYYPDGVKKYQKTFYKGAIKNIQRWDKNGKKIIEDNQNMYSGWPVNKRNEMIDKCSKDPNTTREMCECVFKVLSSEFSYEEYAKYDSMKPSDIPADVLKRSEGLVKKMMECAK